MENYDKEFWENKKCLKYDCRKGSCKCGLKKVYIPTALGDDSKDSPVAPKNGAYCNAIVVYEANDHVYIYSTEGVPTLINVEGGSSEEAIEELEKKLDKEILDRGAADDVLQQEIDDLKNSPDVVDIVATYAALQAYDTSHLGDNDIIRVLADETHDGQSTYYRWDKQNSTWTYIGSIPAINVVQTTGTSQADVMSQNAVTEMVFADPGTNNKVKIGGSQYGTFGDRSVAIGSTASSGGKFAINIGSGSASGISSIAIGHVSSSTSSDSITIGEGYTSASGAITIGGHLNSTEGATGIGSIALGYGAETSQVGEMNIGTNQTAYGYNSSNYRLLTGLYDAQSAHDAVNLSQLSGLMISGAGAPTTSTVGTVGKLYEDTTNGKLYICTAIVPGTDPDPDTYTWEEVGGGPTVVQTTGTSQTDVMSQDATTKMVYKDGNSKTQITLGSNAYTSNNDCIAIGVSANTVGTNAIAIGKNTKAATSAVAIGHEAGYNMNNNYYGNVCLGCQAGYNLGNIEGSVSLGYGSKATRTGEVNVGSTSSSYGFNSTNYRVIGGVHDGQNAHDAATVGQLNGRVLQNAGAPTTATVGTVGQLLEDTTNGKLYQCTAVSGSTYTWTEVGAGGGGGDTVYSTKTTSNSSDGGAVFIGPLNASQTPLVDPTTVDNHYRYFWAMPFDVNGQDNFGIPGSETINIGGQQNGSAHNTSIGYRTKVLGGDSNTVLGFQSQATGYSSNVVIGDSAKSGAGSAVVIGRQAQTALNGTIALGAYSQPTRMGEMNIGTSQSSYGYNNTNYRVIGGVHDGQGLHDAATVAQGNTLATAAPDTSTVGVLGQLWTDTTNMHTYQCTAISGSTYTWQMRW